MRVATYVHACPPPLPSRVSLSDRSIGAAGYPRVGRQQNGGEEKKGKEKKKTIITLHMASVMYVCMYVRLSQRHPSKLVFLCY